ncbi:signal transduction histidine kinase [Tepidimonas ignava]|uniref:Virulence sensor protein BvgS n=1 Tax=Tepidimonas ignava TaxID=114249 RepID=A0A4R3L3Z1_9BURK|nr:ATP-binding protein [Tepidimonas ignava]TCS94373.1 signal transduction histidine kinase [Tepidimonas ignava]
MPDLAAALALAERRLTRERQARKQAEALLEAKSRDLYLANQQLRALAQDLERQVAQRTEDLARARDEAVAASRAKTDFLAVMSHEIRTPLNGVLGMLELLQGTALDDEQRHLVATARHSAQLLLALLNDILDFSKIEAGRLVLESVPFQPAALVRATVDGLRGQAHAKGLALTCHAADDLPPWVRGDPTRLQQVLVNLVGNAIKFTEQGWVAVRAEWRDAHLVVAVQDTGIGIEPARVAALFEPFVQTDASHTRRFGGTGLGLAICHRLIQAMGGTIDVVSAPGQGSTFTFRVPLPVVVQAPASQPAGGATTQWRRGARALVVEDNAINQQVVCRLLQRQGVETVVAGDGAQALALLREEPFDLVLMDCQLPGMDGWETTRRARAQGFRGPVVALTANATEDDRRLCLAAGMDDFLAKPFTVAGLQAVLARWVPADPPASAAPMAGGAAAMDGHGVSIGTQGGVGSGPAGGA